MAAFRCMAALWILALLALWSFFFMEARLPRGKGITTPMADFGRPWIPRSSCTIFTLGDYPNGQPPFVRLNILSWRRQSGYRCEPVLVNDSNVLYYVPDMPREFFSMPYAAAKSDLIRYALLYHHGGMYMDTDFLAVGNLDSILARLRDYDFISYEFHEQNCSLGTFSSNFMAGRRGSVVFHAIWEAQKVALVRHCPETNTDMQMVCCFDDPRRSCVIPWAGVGERIAHPVLGSLLQANAYVLKVFCFGREESFVPEWTDSILDNSPTVEDAIAKWRRFGVPRPLGRTMYHLFNAIHPFKNYGYAQLFDTTTVLGFLYNSSFSAPLHVVLDSGLR